MFLFLTEIKIKILPRRIYCPEIELYKNCEKDLKKMKHRKQCLRDMDLNCEKKGI